MLVKYILVLAAASISHANPVDVVSSTEATEFGAYVNPNPKNICEGDELEVLTACASEVLSKLDECKPDDLACECCALQSMKRDCYGLCPNTASGNFLAVLYDDCETMNDVNACNLPFKKHDAHVAKFLRPNARLPVEEKEPDFVIKSIMDTIPNSTNSSIVSFMEHKFEDIVDDVLNVTNSTSWDNSTSLLNATSTEESSGMTRSIPVTGLLMFYMFVFMILYIGVLREVPTIYLRT